ncbi:MAG: 50S ribosomal protein L32 [Planctomycetota bacterium]
MANPKRKISRARGRKRRSHQGLRPPQLVPCRQCHTPKLPHRVCHNCGHYGGREVTSGEEP